MDQNVVLFETFVVIKGSIAPRFHFDILIFNLLKYVNKDVKYVNNKYTIFSKSNFRSIIVFLLNKKILILEPRYNIINNAKIQCHQNVSWIKQ